MYPKLGMFLCLESLLLYIFDAPSSDNCYVSTNCFCLLFQIIIFFREMGFDKETVGKILCRSPEIFASNVESTLKKKIDFLIDFGVSKHHLPRIIRKYPEILLLDINDTLLPRYDCNFV